jgi:hypothetical protein
MTTCATCKFEMQPDDEEIPTLDEDGRPGFICLRCYLIRSHQFVPFPKHLMEEIRLAVPA